MSARLIFRDVDGKELWSCATGHTINFIYLTGEGEFQLDLASVALIRPEIDKDRLHSIEGFTHLKRLSMLQLYAEIPNLLPLAQWSRAELYGLSESLTHLQIHVSKLPKELRFPLAAGPDSRGFWKYEQEMILADGLRIWLSATEPRNLHAVVVDVVLALSSATIELPAYCLLWIVDYLPYLCCK